MKFLVIIDMQNDFVSGSLANPAARDIISKIRKYAEDFKKEPGTMIIATRDTHQEDYLNTQEGKKLPIVHCIEGTNGWEIVEELKPIAERIIDKPTFGYAAEIAQTIALADEILPQPVESIEFVGTVTEICVVSNVLGLKPYFPEARFVVHADMCAGLSEEGHKAALTTMKACQVDVVGE